MKYVPYVLGVLVLAAAGWGAVHFIQVTPRRGVLNEPLPQHWVNPLFALFAGEGAPDSLPANPAPPGWLVYQNAAYHFSVDYPAGLTVKAYNEGGDAITISFQNVKNVEGFQIYITPYYDTKITDARFRQDEPSGVRDNVNQGTVDDIPAVTFYGSDPRLGDTAEIWFINRYYLYEVTTLKPLAPALLQVMQTWKFVWI